MNNLAHMATSSTLDNVAVGSEHETVVSDTSNLETTMHVLVTNDYVGLTGVKRKRE